MSCYLYLYVWHLRYPVDDHVGRVHLDGPGASHQLLRRHLERVELHLPRHPGRVLERDVDRRGHGGELARDVLERGVQLLDDDAVELGQRLLADRVEDRGSHEVEDPLEHARHEPEVLELELNVFHCHVYVHFRGLHKNKKRKEI